MGRSDEASSCGWVGEIGLLEGGVGSDMVATVLLLGCNALVVARG